MRCSTARRDIALRGEIYEEEGRTYRFVTVSAALPLAGGAGLGPRTLPETERWPWATVGISGVAVGVWSSIGAMFAD